MAREPEVGENWECPYCGRSQVVLSQRRGVASAVVRNDYSVYGPIAFYVRSITCANEACRQLTLTATLCGRRDTDNYGGYELAAAIKRWSLLPESSAKPQPDYIPEPIRADYYEACRIRDLSPKASATISRRCLQGMIRDFCDITRNRLIDEIRVLRQQVDEGKSPAGVQPDTVDAIDHVRKIGNIGAHMEADVNLIVDIDPDEAQTLIGLLELLFEEWYVARNVRAERLKAIGIVAANKAAARLAPPAKALPVPAKEPD